MSSAKPNKPHHVTCVAQCEVELAQHNSSVTLERHQHTENESKKMAERQQIAAKDLISKRNRTTAPVWQYFGFVPNADGEPDDLHRPTCKICMQGVTARDGNTSNLKTHLKTKHPVTYRMVASTNDDSRSKMPTAAVGGQTGIATAFAKCTPYSRDSMKWKTCTAAVTNYLAKGTVSFNTVEKKEFKNMVQNLDPRYELPGRKYFSKTAVPALYNRVREDLQTLVSGSEFYSLTTDMWSARNMSPYMSLTFHTITPEWKLETKCLQTSFFPEQHTAENLAESLKGSLENWNLDEKNLVAITTDNASNIKAAVERLDWQWLNCFGHNLNLAVTNSVAAHKSAVDRALGVCHSITTAFSHSWKRQKALHTKQKEMDLPDHRLITVRTKKITLLNSLVGMIALAY